MKSIIPIIALFLVITSCANSRKQLTAREAAISLIEKEYPANGRRLEYSQVDSTDAELKGYFIGRIYIDNGDSIKVHKFHLNYVKTKIDVSDSFIISSDEYKTLLVDGRIFTDDMDYDFDRIYSTLIGIDINHRYNSNYDSIRIADSIAAVEAMLLEYQ